MRLSNIWCIECRLPMKGISYDYLRCRNCGEWYARTRTKRRPAHISPDSQRPKRTKCRKLKSNSHSHRILSRNPHCIKCRSRMRKAGTEKGRKVFRCPECRVRAAYGTGRRTSRPAEHVASCIQCRRSLVTGGSSRQYLRCIMCRYLVRREGVKEARQPREHLASCVGCKRPMTNSGYRGRPFFYCARCHWAASAHCSHQPQINDDRLPAFVQAYVPRDLPWEIRNEVETEILLAILKTRRAKNGHGLTPKRMSREIVVRFVKKAWRGRDYQYKHVSLDAPIAGTDRLTLGETIAG